MNIKFYAFGIFLFLLMSNKITAQTYDEKIETITKKIVTKLNKKIDYQIAVYPFSFLKENETELATLSMSLVQKVLNNNATNFKVMDRETIETYLKEHKLSSQGLIDPKTAKDFGMLIAADAYVTGRIFVFGSVIKLIIKVTHTQTGEIIAIQDETLPIDYDMAQFLEIEGWKQKQKEAEKNKSSDPNCAEKNVGDFCFENKSKNTYYIRIQDQGTLSTMYLNMTLNPGEYDCFKNLPLKAFYYITSKKEPVIAYKEKRGNFMVKECESDVIILK